MNIADTGFTTWAKVPTLDMAPAPTGAWSSVMSSINSLKNSYVPAAPQSSGFFRLKFPPLP